MTLRYTTEDQRVKGNRYRIVIGERTFENTVEPSSQPTTVDFGPVEIPAGTYDLKIEPIEIKSGELMKLYNMVLEPI